MTDMAQWSRLGVIAGGGRLPALVAGAENEAGRAPFVVRLKSFADQAFDGMDAADFAVTEIGRIQDALKAAGCDAICFAGMVSRPDWKLLSNLDARTAMLLPKVISAARGGDDALLRTIIGVFEDAGFRVVGADEALRALTPEAGPIAGAAPAAAALEDARKALQIARAVGVLDIGQGAVVCDGLVLAVEAQEGTDAMLSRVANLPGDLRGAPEARRGVLGKAPKPIQERRVDLPVIGERTVRNAAAAGLAGIAVEAGGALIVEREKVVAAAEAASLFIIAMEPEEV